jgi:hypothetical protein
MIKKITYYFKSYSLDRTDRIYHSLLSWLNKKLRVVFGVNTYKNYYRKGLPLKFQPYINSKDILKNNTFNILNRSLSFKSEIPWNYPNNGKDWRDNLSFFFFLTQEDLPKEKGLIYIYLYCDQYKNIKLENENLVISYRTINWIKFISKHNLERKTLDRVLYSDYRYLLSILAYNRGGYELLINGISLLFGAYYFKAPDLLKEAKIILSRELSEQILSDGAHFQKSQMFHNLILVHLLDCYNLMQNNVIFEDEQLNNLIQSKICAMLTFNQNIKYHNGDFACFNECVNGYIIPSTEINDYATSLNLKPFDLPLSTSGFRKITIDKLEAVIDIGKMGPDYCLQFAHASVFSFDLRYNNQPFIINNGTSTFEDKLTRFREKSSSYHNTVSYKNKNQAEFFSEFKVAYRPKTRVLQEDSTYFKAFHDGYKRLNTLHQREFKFYPNGILITDEMTHLNNTIDLSFANFHLHPNYQEVNVEDNIVKIGEWKMEFNGYKDIRVLDYQHPLAYNNRVIAKKIEICFTKQLTTKIIRLDY